MNKAALCKYYLSIRSWLPCTWKQKRQIIAQVKENVEAFLEEHPEADFAAVQQQFGSPRQIAAACVDDMDTPALLTALRIRKRVFVAAITVLLTALLLWAGGVGIAVAEQHSTNNGFLTSDIVQH